jgi:hypothetical protein
MATKANRTTLTLASARERKDAGAHVRITSITSITSITDSPPSPARCETMTLPDSMG